MADKLQLEITLENGKFVISAKQAGDALDELKKKANGAGGGGGKGGGGFDAFSSSIQTAIGYLKGFIALKAVQFIFDLGKSAIKAAGEFEQTAVSFEVMIGNADKAQKLMMDIKNFAASTPFTMKGLADNAKLMMSFGIESENVMDNLKMLGDVAGGNQERMNALSLAFSQCASTGRLMGQDLLQMVNQGFNPLQIMSEKTGISIGELKKKMEAGQISFDNVRSAFQAATSEGGKFFGMMDKQSQTIEGKLSTLEDTGNMLGVMFGSQAAPGLYKFIDALTEAGKEGGWLSDVVGFLGEMLGGFLEKISLVVKGIDWAAKKIKEAWAEYNADVEMPHNIDAPSKTTTTTTGRPQQQKPLNFAFGAKQGGGGGSNALDTYLNSGKTTEDLIAQENKKFEDISKLYAKNSEDIIKINIKHAENLKAIKAQENEAIKKGVTDVLGFTLDATKQALDLQDQWEKQQYDNKIARAEALGEYLKAYNDKEYQDELQRQGLADLTKSQQYEQDIIKLQAQLLKTSDVKEKDKIRQQISDLQKEKAKEDLRIKYEKRQKDLDTALELYKKMQANREFERAKAFQIAMVWVNAAAGIAAAWGSAFQMQSSGGVWYLGLALGIASTALLAAMAAAQTAIISSTHAPMFEQGVFDIPKTTPAILHGGESVITKPITESIKRGDISLSGPGGGGGSRIIQLVLDGRVVSEVVDNERNKRSASMGANNYAYSSVY